MDSSRSIEDLVAEAQGILGHARREVLVAEFDLNGTRAQLQNDIVKFERRMAEPKTKSEELSRRARPQHRTSH